MINKDKATKQELEIVPIHSKECIFSEESIVAFSELGKVLQQIHNRLISEGYTIVDGEIVKPKIIEF